MFARELREDFSIEHDPVFLEARYKCAVGLESIVAHGSIQTDDPELPEIGLLILSVSKGIAACAHERLVRVTHFL
jgi:hypothetical protein